MPVSAVGHADRSTGCTPCSILLLPWCWKFSSPVPIRSLFPVILGIYGLATIIPSLAVLVRRLHDTNRSGGWFFIAFVPLVGAIILLVFTCTEGPGRQPFRSGSEAGHAGR
jgi:uncharacterized membrane protein YhaH (DUF805 family)